MVLVLEAHEVRLAQWQLPVRRETLALVALDVYSRVAPIVAEMELACRTLLAESLARVGVRRRLPGLGVQGRHALVHHRNGIRVVLTRLTLRTPLAPLQFLNPVLRRVGQDLRARHVLPMVALQVRLRLLKNPRCSALTSLHAVVI